MPASDVADVAGSVTVGSSMSYPPPCDVLCFMDPIKSAEKPYCRLLMSAIILRHFVSQVCNAGKLIAPLVNA